MTYVNKKYTALMIGATIVIVLWAAHFFSIFSVFNGYSYDLLMRNHLSAKASDKIIVIEMGPDYIDRGDGVWLELLKQLLAADAKQIGFTFLPKLAPAQFYQMAVDSQKTVFGVQMEKSSEESNQLRLILPIAAQDKKILYGLLTTAPSQHGVYREQYSVVDTNGIMVPSFEKRLADQFVPKNDYLAETQFKINFIGNQERIPRIRIERVLNGGLVSELVSGRTVVIGLNQHQSNSGYYTPVSSDQSQTSEVMFHAFALDSLLSNRHIKGLPDYVFLLLIILTTITSLFLCQWLAFKKSMVLSIILTLIYIMVSWLTLHFYFIWLPFTELMLAQWLSIALVWSYRVNQEHQNLDQMLSGFSLKLQELIKPTSIYSAEEPWEQLIAMINQSLQLNRVIFLERVPGDHRLKEIKSMNCSIDDIKESRRDYERIPYSTAISQNKPILLDHKFLKKVSTSEQQYMAPLIFAGEVLGFWVYTIEPEKIKSQKKFNALTSAFMVQISEILHYRQEWQQRIEKENNTFGNYLRVENTEHLHQLNQFVMLMDKRVFDLKGVFNSINSSCILYDLFGKLLMVNKDMEEVAKQAELRLFNMTMLEFIIEISDFDEFGARNIIQRVIFDHVELSIPVTHEALKRNYMLHIRPLNCQTEKSQHQLVPDESQIFQISGVLCELVDMSEIKRLYQLKETMYERYNFLIHEDLSSIVLAISMLEDEKVSAEEMQFVLGIIKEKADEALEMLGQVSEQMDVEIEQMLTNNLLCYPVDSKAVILKAITQMQETLDQREIILHMDLPEYIDLVFASPLELETVVNTVLKIMIEDTYDAHAIWIEVKEKESNLIYQIHNNGIGLSGYQLDKPQDHESGQEAEIINFQDAVHRVKRWGGSLSLSSKMGEGSKAELSLRSFL